jgi:hypothetical protein
MKPVTLGGNGMYPIGYKLKTSEDFENALIYRMIVSVTETDQHLGSGCIYSFNEDKVKMASGEYNKAVCEFKVVQSTVLIYSKKVISYSWTQG